MQQRLPQYSLETLYNQKNILFQMINRIDNDIAEIHNLIDAFEHFETPEGQIQYLTQLRETLYYDTLACGAIDKHIAYIQEWLDLLQLQEENKQRHAILWDTIAKGIASGNLEVEMLELYDNPLFSEALNDPQVQEALQPLIETFTNKKDNGQ